MEHDEQKDPVALERCLVSLNVFAGACLCLLCLLLPESRMCGKSISLDYIE